MADVFISYHTDSGLATVREIAAALESAGVSCWYADRDVKGGDFAERITQAIDECRIFLLLLNEQSDKSEDVCNEVKLAYDRYKLKEKIEILPYRIADCRPTGGMRYYLTRFVIIDRKAEEIPVLVSRVSRLLGREPVRLKPAQHTPTQNPAPAPPIVLPAQPRITFPIRRIYCPTIAAGYSFTVGIRKNSTIIGAGTAWYSDLNSRRGVVSLAVGNFHIVGLEADGTVFAVGDNIYGKCDVSGWTGVVAIAAGNNHTMGLKVDGTVLATGQNVSGQCDVSGWTGVVAIAAGGDHTVGLKADGTVLATGYNNRGQCSVSDWTGVVALAAATGNNFYGQCKVTDWSSMATVTAGCYHTAGLKNDGTVLATGNREYGMCNVSEWTGVTAITAGFKFTVGLKADGTVLATGENSNGQCNVQSWRDIRLPEWVEI